VLLLVGCGVGVFSVQLLGDVLGNPCERTSTPDLTLPGSLFWSSMVALGIGIIMGMVVMGSQYWRQRDTVLRRLAIVGVVLGIPGGLGLLGYGALTMLGGNLCG
jgi:hypothetical protein